ncbi:hypothetical protein C6P46_002549 [Rhodotorula mucilaginosa]|uniref:Uncharacterized protein n=1 Tax=Rhodotorula mucilaginosa TaxID=5537 RepID=A0A9P6W8I7_RHOMI|nr:hypothetical protein C6P46_002549 [Rhodotorula mucilaginosa]TKA50507.1 hypothetical protein B0A53_06225 [Rhodotorula sp. CCFEE 5036]
MAAIAPITGMFHRSILTNVSLGIGFGLAGGFAFWYGNHLPKALTIFHLPSDATLPYSALEYSIPAAEYIQSIARDPSTVRARDAWYLEQEQKKNAQT